MSIEQAIREAVHAAVREALADAQRPRTQGLLRVRDAAEWLGVGQTKIRQWIDRGDLPSVQLDSLVRIRMEDLETFAAQVWRDR